MKNKEIRTKAKSLYNQGYSFRKIGKMLNKSHTFISYQINNNDREDLTINDLKCLIKNTDKKEEYTDILIKRKNLTIKNLMFLIRYTNKKDEATDLLLKNKKLTVDHLKYLIKHNNKKDEASNLLFNLWKNNNKLTVENLIYLLDKTNKKNEAFQLLADREDTTTSELEFLFMYTDRGKEATSILEKKLKTINK